MQISQTIASHTSLLLCKKCSIDQKKTLFLLPNIIGRSSSKTRAGRWEVMRKVPICLDVLSADLSHRPAATYVRSSSSLSISILELHYDHWMSHKLYAKPNGTDNQLCKFFQCIFLQNQTIFVMNLPVRKAISTTKDVTTPITSRVTPFGKVDKPISTSIYTTYH
ncbi:hypothetical protein YC2023_042801 [Brassica napus]